MKIDIKKLKMEHLDNGFINIYLLSEESNHCYVEFFYQKNVMYMIFEDENGYYINLNNTRIYCDRGLNTYLKDEGIKGIKKLKGIKK